MDLRKVGDGFAVAGQIGRDDIEAIARAGFRSLVCNRPDHEDGAVAHDSMRAVAEGLGLEFHYIPVDHRIGITQDNVIDTARIIALSPKPVLAYCRSGARSANLYTIARQSL
ncbi:MAG: TIGR01244 family sulfur transferase [Rhizobiaceae bacterium]